MTLTLSRSLPDGRTITLTDPPAEQQCRCGETEGLVGIEYTSGVQGFSGKPATLSFAVCSKHFLQIVTAGIGDLSLSYE